MTKHAFVAAVVAALIGSAVARADVVTEWNKTMVAGLEASKLLPPPWFSRFGRTRARLQRRGCLRAQKSPVGVRRRRRGCGKMERAAFWWGVRPPPPRTKEE
jgi:hypothetical protein